MLGLNSWPGDPVDVLRRSDPGVGGHGVARGVVQVVGPIVDIRGSRLDFLDELAVPLHIRHAAGPQHAHYFVDLHVAQVVGNQQRDQVLGIGQRAAVELVGRNGTVKAERLNVLARLPNVGGIGIEPLDHVALAGV
jgi:hypothetical protein